jgi:hypothetical protein
MGSITGAGAAEPPEPLREQNLHRYLRIQGLPNTELINSGYGSWSHQSRSFSMNKVGTNINEYKGFRIVRLLAMLG